jgi:hypothetical protein
MKNTLATVHTMDDIVFTIILDTNVPINRNDRVKIYGLLTNGCIDSATDTFYPSLRIKKIVYSEEMI